MPTLYEWCGGHEALSRLTHVFYAAAGAAPPPDLPSPRWGRGEAPPHFG